MDEVEAWGWGKQFETSEDTPSRETGRKTLDKVEGVKKPEKNLLSLRAVFNKKSLKVLSPLIWCWLAWTSTEWLVGPQLWHPNWPGIYQASSLSGGPVCRKLWGWGVVKGFGPGEEASYFESLPTPLLCLLYSLPICLLIRKSNSCPFRLFLGGHLSCCQGF